MTISNTNARISAPTNPARTYLPTGVAVFHEPGRRRKGAGSTRWLRITGHRRKLPVAQEAELRVGGIEQVARPLRAAAQAAMDDWRVCAVVFDQGRFPVKHRKTPFHGAPATRFMETHPWGAGWLASLGTRGAAAPALAAMPAVAV